MKKDDYFTRNTLENSQVSEVISVTQIEKNHVEKKFNSSFSQRPGYRRTRNSKPIPTQIQFLNLSEK